MNKVEKIISPIFTIFGIVFIIIGIIALIDGTNFKERAVEVTGEIADIQTYYEYVNGDRKRRHDVYVDYTYDGIEYEDVLLGEYNAGMNMGEDITLLCDPDNPGDIRTGTGTVMFPIIFLAMGGVFLLLGILFLVFGAKKKARKKQLLAEGRVLQAVVENIDLNTSYRVNGRHPYVIYCTYTDESNGTIYRFKSDNIWNNPEILFPIGSSIRVYVDRNDFSRYYVDAEHGIST